MIYTLFLFLTFSFISCSSAPENSSEPEVTTQASSNQSGEGVLDQVLKNEECGLLDVFYDGCKKIYSDAEKSFYKKE